MKRLVYCFVLLWLCCVAHAGMAQAPAATDSRDFIGQRLGWSADKIYEAMKGGYYAFDSHLVLGKDPGTALYYKGPKGETLSYFIIDGQAKEASLTTPLGSQAAQSMMNLVSQGAKFVAFEKQENVAQYKSPYAKITIYPNESTSKLCFWYVQLDK